jgi:hypothetical protein
MRVSSVTGVVVLSFLLFWFGRFIQTSSFDLVQHFLLVDELMKHAAVRPEAIQRIGAMALYPPAAHWMAAIIGWIGGSGLVGISIVAIASTYLVYLFIFALVGASGWVSTVLFLIAFLLLRFTKSQVGWEIVDNFFYPQLVADVLYFGALWWIARNRAPSKQILCVLIAGAAAMWVQPLIAVHIFAAGCVLLAFHGLQDWKARKALPRRHAAFLMALAIVSLAIIVTNPAFKVMRDISANDGYLMFGYPSVALVIVICAAFGVFNLWRGFSDRAEYVDTVLGAAVISAVFLAVLQFALLKLHGAGSVYAVKKHMFIVVTLGIMNGVRAGSAYFPPVRKSDSAGLLVSVFAGVAAFSVLQGFNTPVAPIVNALDYANHAAEYQLPEFVPGNTVADDSSLPLMGNVMVTLTAFQHPFDARAISWQRGTAVKEGANYVMMGRTDYLDKICPDRLSHGRDFVVVDPNCLTHYAPGETLSFAVGGNGWQYAENGWGGAEPWGAWSLGDAGGSITLAGVPKGAFDLVVDGQAYLLEQHPAQTITAEVNGRDIATWKFDSANPAGQRVARIPVELTQDGLLHIVLKAPGAVSPAQIGQSADARVLGIGLKTLTLRAE